MENGYAERPTGRINSGSLNSVPEFYGRRSESAECWLKTLGRLVSPSVYHWDENTMLEVAMLKINVLKPVPQHPLEPELDFKRGLWNRYFPGGHAMSMRSIDPGRRRGSRGEEQPPWWGLGRSPRSQR